MVLFEWFALLAAKFNIIASIVVILMVNMLYLPVLRFGLVSDDAIIMVMTPFNLHLARWFSITLHTLVAIYIYCAFGMTGISFLAAVCFSVHPMTAQVTSWTAGRHYGVNALLCLFAWLFQPIGALALFAGSIGILTVATFPMVFLLTKYWWLVILTPAVLLSGRKAVLAGVKGKIHGDGWLQGGCRKIMIF